MVDIGQRTYFEIRFTPLCSSLESQRIKLGHLSRSYIHPIPLGMSSNDRAQYQFLRRWYILDISAPALYPNTSLTRLELPSIHS
jgi:hypothetical protein